MNGAALQSFGFGDQLVRVAEKDGAPWFVAKDVCASLEIGNSRQALTRLDDDEKGVISNDTLGGLQDLAIVSESGVFALVFTSRKAVAREFRRWVTGEVLPALRRTGHYELPANDDEDDDLPDPPDLPGALAALEDLDKTRVAVDLVKTAFRISGAPASRRLWASLGLPPLGDAPGELPGDSGFDAVLDSWFADRVVLDDGARVRNSLLYGDYLAWARTRSVEPRSQAAFGRFLKLRGIRAIKSSRMIRIGARLREPPA